MLEFEKLLKNVDDLILKERDTEDLLEWKESEMFYLECNEKVAKYYIWLQKKTKERKKTILNKSNSTILYLLGVTDEKPTSNLRRTDIALPDIDFDTHRKNEVQQYLIRKFGKDRVTLMGTFLKLKVKSSIKDVLRVLMPEYLEESELVTDGKGNSKYVTVKKKNELGMSAADVNILTKKFNSLKVKEMDYKNGIDYLDDAMDEDSEIREFFTTNSHIYEILKQVLGAVKATGIHAGGVVVAADNVNRIVPCSYDRNKTEMWVTQPNMDYVESSGLIKYDFLGLNTLEDIWRTFLLIERNLGKKLTLSNIPMNDPNVIRQFTESLTESIFQFKTDTIRPILTDLSVIKNVTDLSIITSIGRPGPMEMGMHKEFVKIINKEVPEEYFHPSLKPILKETYSVMCFQEQIMQIVVALADFTPDESVTVMKAMSKKKMKVLMSFKKAFIERSILKYPEMEDFDKLKVTNDEKDFLNIRVINNSIDDESLKIMKEYLITEEDILSLVKEDGEKTSIELNEGNDTSMKTVEEVCLIKESDTVRKFRFYRAKENDGSISFYFNNIEMMLCEKIWAYMEAFAKYGFNKSHALAYSMKSYICMYLKYYYEIYWKTAVLTNIREKNKWKDEFKVIYPLWKDLIVNPNINESNKVFQIVEKEGIKKSLMSLSFINDVGDIAVDAIMRCQPYSSFADFYTRVNKTKVNSRTTFNLINAGVFDIFNEGDDEFAFRKSLYKIYFDLKFQNETHKTFKDYYLSRRKSELAVSKDEKEAFDKLVEIKKLTKGNMLSLQNQLLNLSTFDYYTFYNQEARLIGLKTYKTEPISIKEALKKNHGEMVVIVGALKEEIKPFNTKSGKKMAIPTIINENNEIDMTVWSDNLEPNKVTGFSLIELPEGTPLVVFGKINHYNGKVGIQYFSCAKLA